MQDKTILLGSMLVDRKLINVEQLDRALVEHKRTNDFIGVTLVKLGMIREAELMPILSEQLGIQYIQISDMTIPHTVIEKLPAKFAFHYKVMPLRFKDNILTLGMSNPLDVHLIDDMR
ncbi:MAG: type II secretion system protein GspE, partial [Candidatus Omnitrophota bacterium]